METNTTGRGEARYGVPPDLLAELCDRAPDGVCVMERKAGSSDYIFRYMNAAFETLYGCQREKTLGTSTVRFMKERSSAEDHDRILSALGTLEPFRIRRGMTRPDGAFFWLEINFQPIPWDLGVRWMFITRDATREKHQHERMVQLTTALEQGYEPIAISTPVGKRWIFSYVNDAFTIASGYLPEELIGNSWDVIIGDERDIPRIETIRAALFAGQQVRTDLTFRRKNGELGTFEVNIQPIRDPASGEYTSVVSVYRDITEARQREQKLTYEAEHDPLTGLYNRRYLERALHNAISMTRDAPAHALLFADLDGFKNVNDTLGHDVGDQVLKAAAQAFQAAVFQTDALARWGGDEFAILLYHCSLDNARRTADEIMNAFHASVDRHGTTVSIGVVPILAGETVPELIRRADRVCYRAKAAGRDRVLFDSSRGNGSV